MTSGVYDKLSEERKKLQTDGDMPLWWTTGGWQLFKSKYLYQADNPRQQYQRIASTLAAHTPDPNKWSAKFFDLMWKGWLSPSTPILANTGTSRGLPVSCAGGYIADSINDIYESKRETAMLTKMGFGTASYLGDIRPRGSEISSGGTSMGIMPIIEGFQSDMEYVAQGTSRRGSWAGYVPIDHGDFDEVCTYLEQNPDGNNIGWCVSKEFIDKLINRDEEALRRYGKALKTKMVSGKGYIFFQDKANAKRPEWYVKHNLDIKSPQLCAEIMLHSSEDYTYTCVLASMNLALWDEWKDTDAVFCSTVFLDCVCQEFLERAKNIKGLEKAVAATKKGRALGLGVCGFASYLQSKMIAFESFEAHMWNNLVFSTLREEAEKATKWIAEQYGEPEWCKGYGRANSHLCVTGDTYLFTKDGQIAIKELVGKNVEVWNGFNWTKSSPFSTGVNDLYEIKFSNGSSLKCTPYHKFLVATPKRDTSSRFGISTVEVAADKLRVGDCLPKFESAWSEASEDLPYAYTSGLYAGDGSVSNSKAGKYPRKELRLYGEKMKLAEFVEWKSSTTWGGEGCVRGYLPDEVLDKGEVPLKYSRSSRLEWLCGLTDTDGSVGSGSISISMKDYSFAFKVALLVQSLGGVFSVIEVKRVGGYVTDNSTYYLVNISNFSCGKIFSEEIKPKRVKVPISVTKKKIASNHMVEVVSITPLKGKEETFCLTEPEYGTAIFNGIMTKQCAVAPTKSTALIMGGVSEGISPDTAMVYTQRSAGGEIDRVNPYLLKLMKDKGVYTTAHVEEVRDAMGSVQAVDWLTEGEKLVFRTAFEINQHVILRLASTRGRWIDQWQSLNLYFAAGEDEAYINEVHKEAFLNEDILALYYVYSKAGIQASSDKNECIACS